MAVYKQPWAEVEANIIANSRGGDLGYELDEARQMWDMDSTPVAPQTRRETRRETISEAIDAVERDSRLPPVAPSLSPIDFTPSQAVSGYQSGGYTGGTSNG